MKLLSQEEKAALQLRTPRSSKVRHAIEALETGQSLLIMRDDSPNKEGPKEIVAAIRKKDLKELVVHTLADGSGWVVDRMK